MAYVVLVHGIMAYIDTAYTLPLEQLAHKDDLQQRARAEAAREQPENAIFRLVVTCGRTKEQCDQLDGSYD